MSEKPKDKTLHISNYTHQKLVDFLKEEGDGKDIGKFADMAIIEKIERLKYHNPQFARLNTQTLISNGWIKEGSSSYKRGNDTVVYTGAYWLFNGERLTQDNYIDKIYDKKKARL